jgi:hypothetical protein
MRDLGCYVQYEFLNKATVKPLLFFGIGYNASSYERKKIVYRYNSNIAWGYDYVQTKFNSIRYSGGIGLCFRLSDRIGFYIKQYYDYIPQDESDWLGDRITVYSTSIGGILRLSKRKNTLFQ